MFQRGFQLCQQKQVQRKVVVIPTDGTCCMGFMHVKTSALIVAYFEAMYAVALFSYLVSKIVVSCCHYSLIIPFTSTIALTWLTFILYQGAKKGDSRKLRIIIISFMVRIIVLFVWLLIYLVVNLANVSGFEVFKEYFIPRTTFIVILLISYIISLFFVHKCYEHYNILRILKSRHELKESTYPCCNFSPIIDKTINLMKNNCCQKHGEIMANQTALLDVRFYSLPSSASEMFEKRLPQTDFCT